MSTNLTTEYKKLPAEELKTPEEEKDIEADQKSNEPEENDLEARLLSSAELLLPSIQEFLHFKAKAYESKYHFARQSPLTSVPSLSATRSLNDQETHIDITVFENHVYAQLVLLCLMEEFLEKEWQNRENELKKPWVGKSYYALAVFLLACNLFAAAPAMFQAHETIWSSFGLTPSPTKTALAWTTASACLTQIGIYFYKPVLMEVINWSIMGQTWYSDRKNNNNFRIPKPTGMDRAVQFQLAVSSIGQALMQLIFAQNLSANWENKLLVKTFLSGFFIASFAYSCSTILPTGSHLTLGGKLKARMAHDQCMLRLYAASQQAEKSKELIPTIITSAARNELELFPPQVPWLIRHFTAVATGLTVLHLYNITAFFSQIMRIPGFKSVPIAVTLPLAAVPGTLTALALGILYGGCLITMSLNFKLFDKKLWSDLFTQASLISKVALSIGLPLLFLVSLATSFLTAYVASYSDRVLWPFARGQQFDKGLGYTDAAMLMALYVISFSWQQILLIVSCCFPKSKLNQQASVAELHTNLQKKLAAAPENMVSYIEQQLLSANQELPENQANPDCDMLMEKAIRQLSPLKVYVS